MDKSGENAEPDWHDVDEWNRLLEGAKEELLCELKPLIEEWDKKLELYGGELGRHDWSKFRPLRLDREEDWSSWLAYLLENSASGQLADLLFGYSPSNSPWSLCTVAREVPGIDGSCRCDLVVTGRDNRTATIEVKIWDRNLDKTFRTAREMERRYSAGLEWKHFILLPEEALAEWERCRQESKKLSMNPEVQEIDIDQITWRQVVVNLREILWSDEEPRESLTWKVWAYSFCGAIEQKIFRHPRIPVDKSSVNSYIVWSMIDILRVGSKKEDQVKMEVPLNDFFNDGFAKYPIAHRCIVAFEADVHSQLRNGLLRPRVWTPYTRESDNNSNGKPDRIIPSSGRDEDSSGKTYLYLSDCMNLKDSYNNPVQVHIGVVWNERDGHKARLYAHFSRNGQEFVHLDKEPKLDPGGPVKLEKDGKHQYLSMLVTYISEFEKQIDFLLDKLMECAQ